MIRLSPPALPAILLVVLASVPGARCAARASLRRGLVRDGNLGDWQL
jgi:hypothetical protein